MAVTFGTPVVNNMASRASYPLAMSGVTSGQPIFVLHFEWSGTATVSSITDTFSTPYSWIQVNQNLDSTSGTGSSLWIGTGGAGTSGTITVNYASQTGGGAAVACIGASTASGLSAIDVHGINGPTASNTVTAPSLTPGASGEGAIMCYGGVITTVDPSSPWSATSHIKNGADNQAGFTTQGSPTSGIALAPNWTTTGSPRWETIGAIVKAAASSPITSVSGVALASIASVSSVAIASVSSVAGVVH